MKRLLVAVLLLAVLLLAVLLLAVLLLAAAPSKFEQRARQYLDEKIQPRPVTYDGIQGPNFEDFTYRSQRCWTRQEGVVCSGCYDHPKHYYGQATVLCPPNRTLCRWVIEAGDQDKLGVDHNQCLKP